MFDSRASLPNEVKADIEQFLSNARGTNSAWAEAQILPTFIRRNIKLAEAPSYGKTIFEYEQNCHGAEDYRNVAQFVHTQFQLPTCVEMPQPVIIDELEDESHSPNPAQHAQPADPNENQAPPSPLPQPDTQASPQAGTEPVAGSDVQTTPHLDIRSIPQPDSNTSVPADNTISHPEGHVESRI